MKLVDWQIEEKIKQGFIDIDPYQKKNIQPCSYDITLSEHFKSIEGKETYVKTAYILNPLEFILGCTNEYISISNNIYAELHGRSSWGRTGLFIQNAGLIDNGFCGQLTLELFNASNKPVKLTPGKRIGQITFEQTETCNTGYGDKPDQKYMGQTGATESRIWMEALDE